MVLLFRGRWSLSSREWLNSFRNDLDVAAVSYVGRINQKEQMVRSEGAVSNHHTLYIQMSHV